MVGMKMIQRVMVWIVAGGFGVLAPWGAAGDGVVLVGAEYPPAVLEVIAGAQESVDLQMYFIITRQGITNDPVNRLVDALIAARKRGVTVAVMVEDSKLDASRHAMEALEEAGIPVALDTPGALLHTKAVVVDRRICIVGSANWSRAAFEDNHEISMLIESEEHAKRILAAFDAVPRQLTKPQSARYVEGVRLPVSFLEAQGAGSRLVTDRAECAFDMYLHLLRRSQAINTPTVPLDGERVRQAIDCSNVRRPRLRLEERYGLIAYDGDTGQVTIHQDSGSENSLVIPFTYWDYGLNRRLSLRARFMYLVALAEANRSTRDPCWFRNQEDLATRYGISDYTISLGLQELERENVLDVTRDEAAHGGDHADRAANVYCVNPLMSPPAFVAALEAISVEYGTNVLAEARALARDLNEPSDPEVIRTFASLIQIHGLPAVTRANTHTLSLKKGSGRRTLAGTMQFLRAAP